MLILHIAAPSFGAGRIPLALFYRDGCPHCKEEKEFLETMKKKYPALDVSMYSVKDPEGIKLFVASCRAFGFEPSGVPTTVIGNYIWVGFTQANAMEMDEAIDRCSKEPCEPLDKILASKIPVPQPAKEPERVMVNIPFIGEVASDKLSLPLFTIVLAGLDSFNPCAFFVLFFLLSLLIHARSRSRMLIVGGTFVFFSGLIYFLFMAAWLNLFLLTGGMKAMTFIAGAVALVIAGLNIKDFFLFKQGVSLSIPDSAKPKLFERMRNLIKSTSILSMLGGTIVLAVVVNAYELLCTAGFPMVFTRVLTLNKLAPSMYYIYLLLYNVVYVIPLAVIVGVFVVTLGSRKLTEWEGRKLKLLSGLMMLGIGGILVVKPDYLNNLFVSFALLGFALIVSWIFITIVKRSHPETTNI